MVVEVLGADEVAWHTTPPTVGAFATADSVGVVGGVRRLLNFLILVEQAAEAQWEAVMGGGASRQGWGGGHGRANVGDDSQLGHTDCRRHNSSRADNDGQVGCTGRCSDGRRARVGC